MKKVYAVVKHLFTSPFHSNSLMYFIPMTPMEALYGARFIHLDQPKKHKA